MNKDLEQAKALLENNEEYTCAACRAGESFASEEHGVRPLMRWLNEGTDLSGASAADRIVGKAAAFLYVLLGVRTVYAPLMSVPARETLRAHGIEAIAEIPINQKIAAACDKGMIELFDGEWLDNMVKVCLEADNPNKHDGMPQAPENCTHDCASCGAEGCGSRA